jgi:hypothetical protein
LLQQDRIGSLNGGPKRGGRGGGDGRGSKRKREPSNAFVDSIGQACKEACGGREGWIWRGNPHPEDHQGHTRLICFALYIPAKAERQEAGGWQMWKCLTAKGLEEQRLENAFEGLAWVDFCPFQPEENKHVDQDLLLTWAKQKEEKQSPGLKVLLHRVKSDLEAMILAYKQGGVPVVYACGTTMQTLLRTFYELEEIGMDVCK